MNIFSILLFFVSIIARICFVYTNECALNGHTISDYKTNVRAEPGKLLNDIITDITKHDYTLECPAVHDCKAWLELGANKSGVYPIKPDYGSIFQV